MASSASFSSSKTQSRFIKIDVNYAKLNTKIKGKFYVDMLVTEGQRLRTKLVNSTSFLWNQKFVFSVPGNFIFDEYSRVSFALIKSRKLLSDFSVGKATAQMKSLFPIADFCKKDEENKGRIKYDDSDDDDDDHTYYRDDHDEEEREEVQEEEDEKENFELKSNVGLPILNKKYSVVGTLNITITAWEKYGMNYLGRTKKSFMISNGFNKLGTLTTEHVAEETFLSCVGRVKWDNLAMEYEDFIMEEKIVVKPTKKKPFRIRSCTSFPSFPRRKKKNKSIYEDVLFLEKAIGI